MKTGTTSVPHKAGYSNLSWPLFGPGMLLQHDDLEQLTTYTRELNRLMFRSLFGCGVVCGLVVTVENKCGIRLLVECGLALDCCGDPIHVPQPQSVPIAEDCDQTPEGPLWVVLCGKEKSCSPRPSMCEDDEESSPTRTRALAGFDIRVVKEKPTRCVCQQPDASDSAKSDAAKTAPAADAGTGKHDCLCVDPTLECYRDHYDGKCCCSCDEACKCDCVVLAKLTATEVSKENPTGWIVDHSWRRFIRPVLMRDPRAAEEKSAKTTIALQFKVKTTPPPEGQVLTDKREIEAAMLARKHRGGKGSAGETGSPKAKEASGQ